MNMNYWMCDMDRLILLKVWKCTLYTVTLSSANPKKNLMFTFKNYRLIIFYTTFYIYKS